MEEAASGLRHWQIQVRRAGEETPLCLQTLHLHHLSSQRAKSPLLLAFCCSSQQTSFADQRYASLLIAVVLENSFTACTGQQPLIEMTLQSSVRERRARLSSLMTPAHRWEPTSSHRKRKEVVYCIKTYCKLQTETKRLHNAVVTTGRDLQQHLSPLVTSWCKEKGEQSSIDMWWGNKLCVSALLQR